MKNFITKVRRDIIKNENLNNLAVITYILAKQRINLRGDCLIDIDYIYNMLDVNKKGFFSDIRNSLIALYEYGYIELKDIKYNSISTQDFANIKPKDDFIIIFTNDKTKTIAIDDIELDKVIQLSKNFKSRMQFIRYYLFVKYMPKIPIGDLVVNKNTILNYHNTLVELQFISSEKKLNL